MDEREKIRLQEQRLDEMREARISRDLNRKNETEARREHDKNLFDKRQVNAEKMYERQRNDKLIDKEGRSLDLLSAEKEKTSRDVMLSKIAAEMYTRQKSEDLQDFIRRENIALQGYKIRNQTDLDTQTSIVYAHSQAALVEIRERVKGEVITKLVSHTVSMKEKNKDAEIQQEQTILEHELKKDFLKFELDLRQSMKSKSDDEIFSVFTKIMDNKREFQI